MSAVTMATTTTSATGKWRAIEFFLHSAIFMFNRMKKAPYKPWALLA